MAVISEMLTRDVHRIEVAINNLECNFNEIASYDRELLPMLSIRLYAIALKLHQSKVGKSDG